MNLKYTELIKDGIYWSKWSGEFAHKALFRFKEILHQDVLYDFAVFVGQDRILINKLFCYSNEYYLPSLDEINYFLECEKAGMFIPKGKESIIINNYPLY